MAELGSERDRALHIAALARQIIDISDQVRLANGDERERLLAEDVHLRDALRRASIVGTSPYGADPPDELRADTYIDLTAPSEGWLDYFDATIEVAAAPVRTVRAAARLEAELRAVPGAEAVHLRELVNERAVYQLQRDQPGRLVVYLQSYLLTSVRVASACASALELELDASASDQHPGLSC